MIDRQRDYAGSEQQDWFAIWTAAARSLAPTLPADWIGFEAVAVPGEGVALTGSAPGKRRSKRTIFIPNEARPASASGSLPAIT